MQPTWVMSERSRSFTYFEVNTYTCGLIVNLQFGHNPEVVFIWKVTAHNMLYYTLAHICSWLDVSRQEHSVPDMEPGPEVLYV